MGSYPDRYPPHDFETSLVITHKPSMLNFTQVAGRICVYPEGSIEPTEERASFTTEALKIEHTVLTEAALRRAAITWLKDNFA